ncbi:hypothetical protein [Paenarthrobacter sp. Y-19]|uniref:hypothetical protein n=1 Tax=Paenarthrobacter TaxID=1742992 RepID=UPI001E818897|nr:hypothetical protein [Paenarthrobacter sp. Y-19]BCW38718.1 hypothetical protein StoSoilB3_02530 [Arthrobacter sp. StoSoilB3]
MKDHVHERIGFREIDEHGNAVQAVSPHVPETAGPPPRRLSVNPFIIALWVLDAGLLWVGIWAIATAAAALVGPAPATYQSASTAQFTYMMLSNAPYALLGGVLLTAGLLFWHAIQWQKKRPTG